MNGRIATAALLLGLIAASTTLGVARDPKREHVEPQSLPGWLRDAIARRVPETTATGVWLHREKIVQPLAAGGMRVSERWAVKILIPRALEAAEACGVTYRSMDKVEVLSAWTILPNGEIWLPDPVRDLRDDPEYWSCEMGDDVRLRRIAPPLVTVGGIVACEHVVVSMLDQGAEDSFFGSDDEPTIYQRLALEIPKGWGKDVVPRHLDGLEIREDADSIAIVANDLPPLVPEEHRPSANAILPRAWVRWWSPDGTRGFKDWNDVARWENDLTASTSKQHGGADAVAERIKPKDPSGFLDAIEKAFDFAARDVRYVAIELGMGGWMPHSPAVVAEKRFGDCKDKTFLLKAILEDWGATSFPVCVRTRNLGPTEPNVPTFAQFDHMILAVPLPPETGADLWSTRDVPGLGRLVFLDATASDSSPWTPREDVQGTKAVVFRGAEAFLVDIPSSPPSAARTERELTLAVDDQGVIAHGSSEERWFGLAAVDIRSILAPKSEDERRRAWSGHQQAHFPGSTLGTMRIDGLDKPVDRIDAETTFAAGSCGKRVANMLILEPGQSLPGAIDVALAPPPRRYSLELGHAREERAVVHVTVPPGWFPEDLPKPVEAVGDLFAGEASWSFAGGVLTYARTATLKVASIPSTRYAEFRSGVGRLRGADATGIVLVQKP